MSLDIKAGIGHRLKHILLYKLTFRSDTAIVQTWFGTLCQHLVNVSSAESMLKQWL